MLTKPVEYLLIDHARWPLLNLSLHLPALHLEQGCLQYLLARYPQSLEYLDREPKAAGTVCELIPPASLEKGTSNV